MDICITPGCGKPAKTRGLCKQCYTAASNAIKRGKVPGWGFLEEHGLAKPSEGQHKNIFTQALEDKLQNLHGGH